MFSPNASRYVETFSSLLTPPQLSLCDVFGNCKTLWTSSKITARLPLIRELGLKAADGKTTLYGYLILPRHIDQASPQSVPVVVNPRAVRKSGRAAQPGRREFSLQRLSCRENGCAILAVDGRGAPIAAGALLRQFAAGWEKSNWTTSCRPRPGAAAFTPALDPDRIGWYGSGYDGFLTLYAMTHSDRIRAGAAISPISNWMLYDSIFTERYLGDLRQNGAE